MRVLLELEGGEPWSQRTASILARQSQWSAYVKVFGRLDDDGNPRRQQQASKKHQGTKSRGWGSLRCSSGYGDLVTATVAEFESKWRCEGQCGGGGSAQRGWGGRKKRG
jgi:hypothetical protein